MKCQSFLCLLIPIIHFLYILIYKKGSESRQNPTDGLLSLVLQIIILKMSCTLNMLVESEIDEDYIKELAQLARDVMKRNNNKPIRLLNPIRRSETILELKGRDNLQWWDKDLCEYGWLRGRKEWSAETNEIFDDLFDR
jgi:hypothetical protein